MRDLHSKRATIEAISMRFDRVVCFRAKTMRRSMRKEKDAGDAEEISLRGSRFTSRNCSTVYRGENWRNGFITTVESCAPRCLRGAAFTTVLATDDENPVRKQSPRDWFLRDHLAADSSNDRVAIYGATRSVFERRFARHRGGIYYGERESLQKVILREREIWFVRNLHLDKIYLDRGDSNII